MSKSVLRRVMGSAGIYPATICIASLFAAMLVAAQASNGPDVAVVFPPWWNAARVARTASAAGEIKGAGAFPNIVVISARPGGRAMLHRAGAWMLLAPGLWSGCAGMSKQAMAAMPPMTRTQEQSRPLSKVRHAGSLEF
jgi:hypothetical protein